MPKENQEAGLCMMSKAWQTVIWAQGQWHRENETLNDRGTVPHKNCFTIEATNKPYYKIDNRKLSMLATYS